MEVFGLPRTIFRVHLAHPYPSSNAWTVAVSRLDCTCAWNCIYGILWKCWNSVSFFSKNGNRVATGNSTKSRKPWFSGRKSTIPDENFYVKLWKKSKSWFSGGATSNPGRHYFHVLDPKSEKSWFRLGKTMILEEFLWEFKGDFHGNVVGGWKSLKTVRNIEVAGARRTPLCKGCAL